MLGSLASGETRVHGFLPGEDCLATLAAMRSMGIEVQRPAADSLILRGGGLRGLKRPAGDLDMGNSGTAMRLFAGLLAGQSFDTRLIGDESLSRRPMERVAAPLRQMGADITTRNGLPPVSVTGGRRLRGIAYRLPVASAQIKSAILLAGLFAEGDTEVIEPAVSRDHTERMLAAFAQPVRRSANSVSLTPTGGLQATLVNVPGDLSSAAFPVLAALIAGNADVSIDNVGLNPSRTGVLEIFRLMGANIDIEPLDTGSGMEPVGRLRIRASALQGIQVPPALVPLAIDEFPAVFIAAAMAAGETVVSGAEELRHKESDRIRVMADGLRALGIDVEETADGARIRGGTMTGGTIDSHGDHRVAMAFAVAAMRASGPIRILDTDNVATSFPGFVRLACDIGMDVAESNGSPR